MTLALAALVVRKGYRGVGTAELPAAAGVSKGTLNPHFGGRQGCFLASVEPIVEETARAVEEAPGWGRGPHGRLRASLAALRAPTRAESGAARLVLVDSLALGAAGLPQHRRVDRRFEAIVAGIGGVLRRRLRRGELADLSAAVGPSVEWAMRVAGEGEEEGRPRWLAPVVGGRPGRRAAEVPWDEPPRSPRARRTLDRRERFIRAAAWVTVRHGYDSLSIPAISYAAASSNEAFYRHFLHRCEPLLEAFDLLAARMTATCRHTRPPTPTPTLAGAAAAGVAALRGEGAAGTVFARLAFVDLPSIGEGRDAAGGEGAGRPRRHAPRPRCWRRGRPPRPGRAAQAALLPDVRTGEGALSIDGAIDMDT